MLLDKNIPEGPSNNDQVNQTDLVVVELMALIIGGAVIMNPERQAGIDESMAFMVNHFANTGLNKAAALVEQIRRKAADNRSDPALLHKLRERPPGAGRPN